MKFHKIHEENDPQEIYDLADVFDIRLWNIEVLLTSSDDATQVIQTLSDKFCETIDNSELLLIGEDKNQLKLDLRQCVSIFIQSPEHFRGAVIQEPTVTDQWKLFLKHPQLFDKKGIRNAVDRLTTTANTEAACERANSKFNRSKNKLSSRMKLPMILARNRAGSNGPPLHKFEPAPVYRYWVEHKHRLAIKTTLPDNDPSRVITRVRREEEEKYTTNIFTTKN